MFWRIGFHAQKSPLQTHLDKEDVTIEEILEQEELLQEIKANNKKLLQFLSKTEVVHKLIQYLTEPAAEEADDRRKYKFPVLACEVLVADIPVVQEVAVQSPALQCLFVFLERDPPLPSSLSLNFVRVVQNLYQRKPQEVSTFLQQQPAAIAANFLKHIETFGLNELLLTLLGAMDEDERPDQGATANWWMQHNFVPQVFQRLTPEHSTDVHINTIRMLSEIVRRFHNPSVAKLAEVLMSSTNVDKFLSLMMDDLKRDSKSVVFTEGTNLLITIVDSLVRREELLRGLQENEFSGFASIVSKAETQDKKENAETPTHTDNREAISQKAIFDTFHAIMDRAEEMVNFLKNPGELEAVETPFGTLEPPLGMSRLKIVELLLVMLKTKKTWVEEVALKLNMINICLDLFFEYHMNNLLHILVEDIVSTCMTASIDTLTHLFKECNIVTRILEAVHEDAKICESGIGIRKGYFGHVTSISNKIVGMAESSSLVASAIVDNTEFQDYSHGGLAERNTKDSHVLGGGTNLPDREVPLLQPSSPLPTTTSPVINVPNNNTTTDNNAENSINNNNAPNETNNTVTNDNTSNDNTNNNNDANNTQSTTNPQSKYVMEAAVEDVASAEEVPAEPSKDERDIAFDARDSLTDMSAATTADEPEESWKEAVIVDNSCVGHDSTEEPSIPPPPEVQTPQEEEEFNSFNYWHVDPETLVSL